jgi:hypothetical protein
MSTAKTDPGTGTVAGVFADEAAADRAVARLVDAHFDPPRDLEVMVAHRRVHEPVSVEERFDIDRTAAVGSAVGGVLGGAGAALVAAGVIPGLGLLAAAPALAVAQGVVLGVAGGFAVGAVVGLGHWREETRFGDAHVHGVAWVGVHARGARAEEARTILREAGARHLLG